MDEKQIRRIITRIMVAEAIIILVCFAISAFTSFAHSNEFGRVIFYNGGKNMFNDFHDSIHDDAGWDTYSKYQTIYPPIVSLYFKFCSLFVPAKYLSPNPRINYLDLPIMYILYAGMLMASLALIWFGIKGALKKHKPYVWVFVFFLCILNYPAIYAFERANIINLAVGCCVFFFGNYDSEKKGLRFAALFALTIAISIKIYPVMFAFVLLRNKRYSDFVKVGVMSALFFFIPFVFYDGAQGTSYLLSKLLYFSGKKSATVNFLGSLGAYLAYSGVSVPSGFTFIEIALLLPFLWLTKEKYQHALITGMALLCFSGANATYCALFLLPAIVLVFDSLNWKAMVYFPIFICMFFLTGLWQPKSTYPSHLRFFFFFGLMACAYLLTAGESYEKLEQRLAHRFIQSKCQTISRRKITWMTKREFVKTNSMA